MADITMCTGDQCPIRANCYRFKAKPSVSQSYFIKSPYDRKKKKCAWLMRPPATNL